MRGGGAGPDVRASAYPLGTRAGRDLRNHLEETRQAARALYPSQASLDYRLPWERGLPEDRDHVSLRYKATMIRRENQ